MKKGIKSLAILITMSMTVMMSGCSQKDAPKAETPETSKEELSETGRTVTDGAGRAVDLPEKVESIVCLNVSTLRYTCYMEAQDLVIGEMCIRDR